MNNTRDARCGECRGRLIGSEVERGMCGHCLMTMFRGVVS